MHIMIPAFVSYSEDISRVNKRTEGQSNGGWLSVTWNAAFNFHHPCNHINIPQSPNSGSLSVPFWFDPNMQMPIDTTRLVRV